VRNAGYGGPRGQWAGELEFTWNRWQSDTVVPWNLWTIVFGPLWGPPEPHYLSGYPFVSLRHQLKAQTLFFDGHVRPHTFDELTDKNLWLVDRPTAG